MYVNLFADGGALVETTPQGDASLPLRLSDETAQIVGRLIQDDETAAAIAAVFLAGVRAGERAAIPRSVAVPPKPPDEPS